MSDVSTRTAPSHEFGRRTPSRIKRGLNYSLTSKLRIACRNGKAKRDTVENHEEHHNYMGDPSKWMLQDCFIQTIEVTKNICHPLVEANNFELKPAMINMIYNLGQFRVLSTEELLAHLKKFLHVDDMVALTKEIPTDVTHKGKDVLTTEKSNKKKLEGFEVVNLTKECSAIVLKKLPLNLRIQGEPQPTNISLHLATRTITHPLDIEENFLVKVGEFIFPTNFVILNMEEDDESKWHGPYIVTKVLFYDAATLREYHMKDNKELKQPKSRRETFFFMVNRGPDSLTDPTSSRGNFHLGVPDVMGPKSVGTRLGDQGAKAGLSLGRPLA
ncbi:hypothetical protein CR513_31765, partial [Mucuna pruriens]